MALTSSTRGVRSRTGGGVYNAHRANQYAGASYANTYRNAHASANIHTISNTNVVASHTNTHTVSHAISNSNAYTSHAYPYAHVG